MIMVGTIRSVAIATLAALFVQNCPIAENNSVEAGWRHGGRNRCCHQGHRHCHRGHGYATRAYSAPAAAPCCQAQAYAAPMPDGSVPYEHSVGYPPNAGAVQAYDGQTAPVPTPTRTYTRSESVPAPAAGAIDQTPPPANPPEEAPPAAAPEPAPNPEN